MEEMPVGMDARSNEYMDGINDMILFLQTFDLKRPDELERLDGALTELACSMDALRTVRFINENGLGRFERKPLSEI